MQGFLSELDAGTFKLHDRSTNTREQGCTPYAFPMATGPDVASRVVVTGPTRRMDDAGFARWLVNEKIAYAYELLNELGLTADDMRLLVPKTQNTGTAAAAAAVLEKGNAGRVGYVSYGTSVAGDPYTGNADAVGLSSQPSAVHAPTSLLQRRSYFF